MTLTANEIAVLNCIALNLYQQANGGRPESFEETTPIWAIAITDSTAPEADTLAASSLPGIVASLSKKGLVTCYADKHRKDDTITLTRAGYDAWVAAYPPPAPGAEHLEARGVPPTFASHAPAPANMLTNADIMPAFRHVWTLSDGSTQRTAIGVLPVLAPGTFVADVETDVATDDELPMPLAPSVRTQLSLSLVPGAVPTAAMLDAFAVVARR